MGRGGSIEKPKSTLAMIPAKYFTVEVPDYLLQSCSRLKLDLTLL